MAAFSSSEEQRFQAGVGFSRMSQCEIGPWGWVPCETLELDRERGLPKGCHQEQGLALPIQVLRHNLHQSVDLVRPGSRFQCAPAALLFVALSD